MVLRGQEGSGVVVVSLLALSISLKRGSHHVASCCGKENVANHNLSANIGWGKDERSLGSGGAAQVQYLLYPVPGLGTFLPSFFREVGIESGSEGGFVN